MNIFYIFLLLFAGFILGIIAMCLFAVAKQSDEQVDKFLKQERISEVAL